MHKLFGRIAAAASALVLAMNCLALGVSAEGEKKTKKSRNESSAAETVEDGSEESEDGSKEKSKKEKDKDKHKDKDSSESEDSAGEETGEDAEEEYEDEEETDAKKENFHRSGAWGYTLLPDNTVSISKYYGDSVHPGVPSEIDGFTVTALSGGWYIDETGNILIYGNIHGLKYDDTGMISGSSVYSPFSKNSSIVEVTIPDTVKYIGAISFKGCKKLKKVNLGSGVQVIGNNCFEGCTSLEGIALPEGVKYIDQMAFSGCTALTQISVPETHLEASVFRGCTSLAKAVLGRTDTIPQLTFSGCTALTEVALPDGLQSVDNSAFEGCTSLVSVTLPDSVKEIRNNAFAGCTSLQGVKMSGTVESIGNSAFADCPITELALPETLTRIGKTAFGMTADGAPMEGFKLICPEYSPAQSYAQNNSLAFETVEGGSMPAVTTAKEEEPESQPGEEQPDPLDSDLMFKLLLVIIGVTALSVITAIVLIIKNHSLGDAPESEEYFPSDDFDEDQDLDDGERSRWNDGGYYPDAQGYDDMQGYAEPQGYDDMQGYQEAPGYSDMPDYPASQSYPGDIGFYDEPSGSGYAPPQNYPGNGGSYNAPSGNGYSAPRSYPGDISFSDKPSGNGYAAPQNDLQFGNNRQRGRDFIPDAKYRAADDPDPATPEDK